MRGDGVRGGLAGISAMLVVSVLVPFGHAQKSTAPPSSGPSKSQRIKVLTPGGVLRW
jgi:hypothetical protein